MDLILANFISQTIVINYLSLHDFVILSKQRRTGKLKMKYAKSEDTIYCLQSGTKISLLTKYVICSHQKPMRRQALVFKQIIYS